MPLTGRAQPRVNDRAGQTDREQRQCVMDEDDEWRLLYLLSRLREEEYRLSRL
jgi:hypothetical protein